MVVTEPDTTFSTTMRRLRDALRERLEGAANARVLLAWPNAAADRDTLALSLAVAFAERGDTVLLAGQDPGQPLSETVGAAQVASFATIGLGGKLDLPHELASRISLLASGRGEPILPRSDQLARLGEAAQGTDLVLLSAFANRDGVLGADLVDWAAEVVLVAPQGSTSREAVLRGLELLPRSKPRSVVLTGAPAR